ncbi:MAG TPA: sigma-70 family RNA polymerase sigma factor [Acidimicrobiales bacterium]|nr:sigma-70 family RNA polymerase sigma factor [Acidimicrobiales bacterium]
MEHLEGLSDPQVMVLVGRFDASALAEVYRRHGRSVYGLARRIVGDPAEAEDVTQEVFLRLWQEPARYDPARASLRTYLLTQVHGRAVDLVRSRTARARREEQEARRARDVSYDLEREVWDMALAARVADALEGLSADERAAIDLAYFGGHTYREVATLLSAPEGTVKSRIRSGLRKMRDRLVEGGVRDDDRS